MDIFLLRHGETEWSRDGRHTGRTDLALTPRGEEQARLLQNVVKAQDFAVVLSSPAERARRTAELAGFDGYQVDEDLWEWDYGGYEGITTPDIRKTVPGWYIWRDGVIPGDAAHPGESVEQVGLRADRAIARIFATVAKNPEVDSPATLDVSAAVIAHGHYLRIFAARWLGLPARDGRMLRLDTGTYCRLGFEHGERVILTWNAPV